MLSVKQDSIKYYFLSLWYDSTWDWTQVFWTQLIRPMYFIIYDYEDHEAIYSVFQKNWYNFVI